MIIKGKLTPMRNRVLVTDMHFGEQKTKSGIIIRDDNGTTGGIYPRWAKVYAKGYEVTDEYEVGDWILIEHGRWSRVFKVDDGEKIHDLQMVETESVLGWSKEKPNDVLFGDAIDTSPGVQHRPEDFVTKY